MVINSTPIFQPPAALKTAVLFLTFNRKDTAELVFEVIKKAQPPRLYIASDGPREEVIGEAAKIYALRKYLLEQIDWECEVRTLFRDKNLGCKYGVSGAINWFFEHEEMGIILEDDCLPKLSFFWFCEELLEKYKYDTRIWHIGGTNPVDKDLTTNKYYYSKYNRIWGWASWRRAWQFYDVSIKLWPKLKEKDILSCIFSERVRKFYTNIFEKVYKGEINTWDYQWFLIRLLNGKAIIPCCNLISNIGFIDTATHTFDKNNPLANLPRGEICFPLVSPDFFVEDFLRDKKWESMLFEKNPLLTRIFRSVLK